MAAKRRATREENITLIVGSRARIGIKFVPPSFPQIRPCGCNRREVTKPSLQQTVLTERSAPQMPESKLKIGSVGRIPRAGKDGYDANYLAKKHGITRDQARRLIRRMGNDRTKLDTAAKSIASRQ